MWTVLPIFNLMIRSLSSHASSMHNFARPLLRLLLVCGIYFLSILFLYHGLYYYLHTFLVDMPRLSYAFEGS